MYSNISQSLFLLLINPRAGLRVGRALADLHRSQWLDGNDLERLQHGKLMSLFEHARNNVSFYRGYKALSADGISLRELLAEYPILTKDDIRKSPAAMRQATGLPHFFIKATTGGTTGAPIATWRDRRHIAMVAAARCRSMDWLGIKPWSRGVSAHGFGGGSWYGKLRSRLARTMIVDGFGKDSNDLKQIAETIHRFRPNYISGYVSDVLALGHACYDAGVKIDRVLTTGEMLYEHQRLELMRLYGGRVSSYYGCNEVGAMGYECEEGNMHIPDEHVIVEVVDERGAPIWDKPGRILLTDLDNYLTPFIRYEVGDLGVLTKTPCPCGRKLTVLKSLEGRTQDALVNADGARLSTLFFAGYFKHLKAIHRLQLVQLTITDIDLLYESTSSDTDSELASVISEIRSRLGPQMQVRPRQVEALQYTSRGKFQLIVPLKKQ